MPEKTLKGKSIAMVIASRDFRDEEYFVPKEILELSGAEIKAVSNQTGQALGADGGEVRIDILLGDLKVSDFDAVVFIGGPGAVQYLDNEEGYRIARETIAADKILAAICIAPTILAKAGVLKGKQATVWSSPLDRNPVKILQIQGAIYQDTAVVIDGKIVTANGPAAAKDFGKAIIEVLTRE